MKRFFILWLKILPLSVFVVWLFISYLEDLGNLNNESKVEKKEFTISGMCQKCQDKLFG